MIPEELVEFLENMYGKSL